MLSMDLHGIFSPIPTSFSQATTVAYGVPGLTAAREMLGYFGATPWLPLLPSTEKEIRVKLEEAELL